MTLDKEQLDVVLARYQALRQEVLELRRSGDLAGAIAKAHTAVDYMEQKQDGLAYFLTAAHDLAALYGAIGDWKSAEPIFEKSLYVRGRVWGTDHENTATASMMLGVARYSLAKYPEAEELLNACIAVRRKVFGTSHPQVALALMNLAAVYDKTGREDEAATLRRDAERMGLPDGPN